MVNDEDKSWFKLIKYHPKIPKIYGVPKDTTQIFLCKPFFVGFIVVFVD